jgi:xylose dehydrogenase (NAD/NADP)
MLDDLDTLARRDWQASDDDGPVRFALVGLGWWTREQVLPAIEKSTFCAATALVSGDAAKAERLAAESDADAALTYDAFHAGDAADTYDAVYVCTPNATHLEYVETAAELGKAVLCEKPMTAEVAAAERMVEACATADVPLMIAYRMQTEPGVRRVKELLADGVIGDPVQVHGHMSDDIFAFIDDGDHWRLTPALSGGATVNDIGIYPLNTTRFLLDADPVAVYGTTDWEHAWFEGQDQHTSFQVEFPDSVIASCTATHTATEGSHLRIVGTEGELTIEPLFFPHDAPTIRVVAGANRATLDIPPRDQMTEEFDYFADCLLTGRDPHPDGEHGLVDMRTIAAIYESAERGERVTVA